MIVKFDRAYTPEDGLSMKDRFKKYESYTTELKVTNELPVIIRLDGDGFSEKTKKYKTEGPFNPKFTDAMQLCAMRLIRFAGIADMVFTGSDEISVIFKPRMNRSGKALVELPFGGEIQKITSLYAAYTSIRFSEVFPEFGAFDCRVFNIPEGEVLNYIMHRQVSLHTNAVSEYAHYYIGKKSTDGLNSDQKIEKLKELGIDFDAVCDPRMRYGTLYFGRSEYKFQSELCQRLRRSDMDEELIEMIEYKM